MGKLARRQHETDERDQRVKPRRVRRPLDLVLDALAPFVPIDDAACGAKVLDFGCGDGKFLDRLQERGWDTSGIEPSTDVAFLRHREARDTAAGRELSTS